VPADVRGWPHHSAWRLAALALPLVAAAAAAQPRPALTADGFNVDLYQGPVMGSSRVVGLGGAYAALGEEAVGIQFNPASVANRTWYSRGRWDWDLTADWLLPNIAGSSRFSFDNSAVPADVSSFTVINVGGLVQYRDFGVGAYVGLQTLTRAITAAATGATRDTDFVFTTAHVDAGYGLLHHQLVLAGGVRVGSLAANAHESGGRLFDLTATGYEVGALIRPAALPLRVGVAFYSQLNRDKPPAGSFSDLAMPHTVVLPWQVTFGVAWQLAGRPMSPAPDYRPPATQPASAPSAPATDAAGRYLLISADVQIAGAVDNAVGVTSFLAGVREESGRGAATSVRLGAESEVWRRRLRLRAGTYYEPSRFATPGRVHGTFGLDVRLFDFTAWGARSLRAGLVGDFARDYSNAGISLGFWH
jgi:hypothetical protein